MDGITISQWEKLKREKKLEAKNTFFFVSYK